MLAFWWDDERRLLSIVGEQHGEKERILAHFVHNSAMRNRTSFRLLQVSCKTILETSYKQHDRTVVLSCKQEGCVGWRTNGYMRRAWAWLGWGQALGDLHNACIYCTCLYDLFPLQMISS